MKIGPEHIGKRVRPKETGNYCATVLCVDGNRCWLRAENGHRGTYVADDNWELVEEPKRPSERIAEILRDYASPSLHVADREAIEAVIDYLDEQWEKK